jgi:hypothetical protein
MSDSELSRHPSLIQQTRVLQIIVGALVMGCLTFFAVTSVTGGPLSAEPWEPTILTAVLAIMACSLVAMRFVVLAVLTSNARRQIAQQSDRQTVDPRRFAAKAERNDGDLARLLSFYQTRTIIGAAMLEGLSMFALVVHMVDRDQISLVIAVAAIAGVAFHFPTTARVVAWIEHQMAAIEAQRAFGGRE